MSNLEEIAQLEGHTDRVWFCAWSPSGIALATCGGDKMIRIWVQDADQVWRCKQLLGDVHTRTIRCVSWSPCGKYLASASFDGTVAIWENKDGEMECIATLEGHENEVKSVVWGPNGKLLATCSRDKSIWIWEVNSGEDYECLSVLHGHSGDVKAVRWHPSGEYLFSCSYDDSIKVWQEGGDDWYSVGTIQQHESTVWSMSFEQSGERFVSCSDDKTCIIWQKEVKNEKTTWLKACTLPVAHNRTIYSVDWNNHGVIASCGADNSICLYQEKSCIPELKPKNNSEDDDMPDLEPIRETNENKKDTAFQIIVKESSAHKTDINCVCWNPVRRDLLASCGDDMIVKIWKFTNNNDESR